MDHRRTTWSGYKANRIGAMERRRLDTLRRLWLDSGGYPLRWWLPAAPPVPSAAQTFCVEIAPLF
ncbi:MULTISPECIES: hypothetical protein [unclassified Synechococcus]|uniref:hypothetical protein n=1 Tax=unclassified Synechococcus TaxID=2626047 RepID=UPI0039B08537